MARKSTLVLFLFLVGLIGYFLISYPAVPASAPAPAPNGVFTFVVLGDVKVVAGKPQRLSSVVLTRLIAQINKEKPQLVFFVGDGPMNGGPIQNMYAYRAYLSQLNVPWYPVIGNHELYHGAAADGKKGDGEQNFKQVFSDKLGDVCYYSVDYRQTRFVVLNTAAMEEDIGSETLYPGGPQWQWLNNEISSAHRKGQLTFVLDHIPAVMPVNSSYTYGWHDADAAAEFVRLMNKYAVKAVFSGHVHAFRDLPLEGVDYIISGGAGAELTLPADKGGFYHYVRGRIDGRKFSYDVVPLEDTLGLPEK